VTSKLSLKRELIFDLGLLSFCALILSSGLLVVMLRLSIPALFSPLMESELKLLHAQFMESPEFKAAQSSGENFGDWVQSFDIFLKRSEALPYNFVELSFLRSQDAQSSFRVQNRSLLFFLVSPEIFHFTTSVDKEVAVSYQLSIESLHGTLDRYKYWVFFISIPLAMLLVFIGYHLLFRRNIFVPISNLSHTAGEFLNENWSARCPVERRDELGQVAEALNEMAVKIQDREKKLVLTIQSLQRANEEIELSKNEQLQIEKLASVGRLAAGVAHEVGNPLGAIAGYVDILRRSVSKVENLNTEIEFLDRIEAETNRISKIIRALLQQARPPQDRIRPVELLPLLERSVALAQISDSIDLEFEMEDRSAVALCEKDQMIQVFLNLLINARHAIEAKASSERGYIKIRVVSRRLPQASADIISGPGSLDTSSLRALQPQAYWMVSVVDNGIGIGADDQKKLFEPFFSTKETGKGTGLGLYVAKSIVESFRGAIVVQSSSGHGTSFSVLLPKNPN